MKRQRGALTEYGLLVALIAVIVIGGLAAFSTSVRRVWCENIGELNVGFQSGGEVVYWNDVTKKCVLDEGFSERDLF